MIGEFLITVFFPTWVNFFVCSFNKVYCLRSATQVGPAFWPQILLGGINNFNFNLACQVYLY